MRAILMLPLLAVASCAAGPDSPARSRAGTISVEWTGRERGSFSATATARWCAADTLLEVIAVRGDTAVGLTLIARDSLRAERYTVNETQLFTPGRPQANVALRMLGSVNLLGFDAMGGHVHVTQGGGQVVSGTLEVRLRPVASNDTLQMKGSFERLPITLVEGLCGRANRPAGG